MDWSHWDWLTAELAGEWEDDMGGRHPLINVGKVAPGSQVQAIAGGVLITPPPELPGERARRWCYGIASVATATALVLTVATGVPWWPVAAMALLGMLVAALGIHQQRAQERAVAPDHAPELHPEQCDTPGCTCRPPVPSYCAGCDQVIEDGRHMAWTVEGLWRCAGCAGTDIAPDPGLAGLLEAVAGTGAATLPIIAGPDPPDLHEQFADDMEVYRQVRVDGAVVREVRDWGSSREVTG